MNLNKVSPEERLQICRKYFIVGSFMLPFVWLVNVVWFFREAFFNKDAKPQIKRYVAWSGLGVVIWTAVIVAWTVIYQTQRVKWGLAGDYISIVLPNGIE